MKMGFIAACSFSLNLVFLHRFYFVEIYKFKMFKLLSSLSKDIRRVVFKYGLLINFSEYILLVIIYN